MAPSKVAKDHGQKGCWRWRVKYMAALEAARDAGRKYGITLVMLYQSLGQLERQFGREGKRAWYDSAAWRAYAAVKDPDTAKELSEVCGSYGVLQTSENRSKGSQHQPGQLLARDSRQRGENVSETKRALPAASRSWGASPRKAADICVPCSCRQLISS